MTVAAADTHTRCSSTPPSQQIYNNQIGKQARKCIYKSRSNVYLNQECLPWIANMCDYIAERRRRNMLLLHSITC